MIDIKIPTVGESINEVTLVKWLKKDGEYVERDEMIAELESEKATFEVNAEQAGVLKTIAKEGDTLKIGDVVAQIDETAAKPEKNLQDTGSKTQENQKSAEKNKEEIKSSGNGKPATPAPAKSKDVKASPVAAAMIADKKVDTSSITPSGTGGKILKDDVLEALTNPGRRPGKTFQP